MYQESRHTHTVPRSIKNRIPKLWKQFSTCTKIWNVEWNLGRANWERILTPHCKRRSDWKACTGHALRYANFFSDVRKKLLDHVIIDIGKYDVRYLACVTVAAKYNTYSIHWSFVEVTIQFSMSACCLFYKISNFCFPNVIEIKHIKIKHTTVCITYQGSRHMHCAQKH